MTELTLVQAVNDGLRSIMREDDSVMILGEDVGPKGGVKSSTQEAWFWLTCSTSQSLKAGLRLKVMMAMGCRPSMIGQKSAEVSW